MLYSAVFGKSQTGLTSNQKIWNKHYRLPYSGWQILKNKKKYFAGKLNILRYLENLNRDWHETKKFGISVIDYYKLVNKILKN